MKHNYARICQVILWMAVMVYQFGCASKQMLIQSSGIETPASGEVNAAFSKVQFQDSLPDESVKIQLLASQHEDTPVSDLQISSVMSEISATPVFQRKKLLLSTHLLKHTIQDDPPVVVKKRLPFWKIALGILLCLIGVGIILYALYGIALLMAVSLLLLAFGADISLLLLTFVGLFLLAVLILAAGNLIAIIGYNLLLKNKSKRILFKPKKIE